MIYHQAGNRNNPNQIIQMLMQPPYGFSLTQSQSLLLRCAVASFMSVLEYLLGYIGN